METSGAGDPGGAAAWDQPSVVETHSAIIVLWCDHAHKIRKPIDLGFLDNRTVAARADQSRREVELNSRLAPDVYQGVLEVRGPDGEVIDHVVRMRRLPAARSLAALVRRREHAASGSGGPTPEPSSPASEPSCPAPDLAGGLREVARQLDHLHAASPQDDAIRAAGSADAVAALWAESLAHLRGLCVGQDAPEIVDDVDRLSGTFLRGRRALFEERLAAGRIVDGHGDLRADDVYLLDDGPRIIDCLEFDDRFRHGDAMLDAAFLAMELDGLGARDLAVVFLEAYRGYSGDAAPPALVHHYLAYRALVRAKVTAIRAEQAPDGGGADARRALELADRAVDSLLRGRVRLVLVGGVSGSGKSTLAAPLAEALGAELLRSDVVRREAGDDSGVGGGVGGGGSGVGGGGGVDDDEAAALDRYAPAAVAAVYADLLTRAGELLAHGRSVVLDATWLDPRRRAEAETVAADAHAELVEVACTAPREELARRIEGRARAGADPSEATVEVLDAQLAGLAPWPDAIDVDTTELDVRDAAAVRAWAERSLGPLPWA